MRKIRPSELALDKPLPWPIYDEYGNLLLREGYVISIPRHLSSLVERGAYAPVSAFTKRPVMPLSQVAAPEKEVVFRARPQAFSF